LFGVAVRGDRRLVDVGLKEVLAEDMFTQAQAKVPLRDAGNKANAEDDREHKSLHTKAKGSETRKKAKTLEDDKLRPITDFFKT
jgi:hypothetical protein